MPAISPVFHFLTVITEKNKKSVMKRRKKTKKAIPWSGKAFSEDECNSAILPE